MAEIMVAGGSGEPESGELAQLVERCDRTAEVRGSSPLFSTSINKHRFEQAKAQFGQI